MTTSGSHQMLRDTTPDHKRSPSLDVPALPAALLLVATGLSLVGAGALLWWREGAAVFLDAPLRTVLAWCF